jgi:hypothetical protein
VLEQGTGQTRLCAPNRHGRRLIHYRLRHASHDEPLASPPHRLSIPRQVDDGGHGLGLLGLASVEVIRSSGEKLGVVTRGNLYISAREQGLDLVGFSRQFSTQPKVTAACQP